MSIKGIFLRLALVVPFLFMIGSCKKKSSPEENLTKIKFEKAGWEYITFKAKQAGDAIDVPFSVAFPPDYAGTERKHPVIYFLHGKGGNEKSDLFGFSNYVHSITKNCKKELTLPIVVTPSTKEYGFFRELFGEAGEHLFAYVDSEYNTLSDAANRAIAGYSMGGTAATVIALQYRNKFSRLYSWAGDTDVISNTSYLKPLLEEEIGDANVSQVKYYFFNGDGDRPSSFSKLTPHLAERQIFFKKVVLKDQGHNLGGYHAKSKDILSKELCSWLPEPSS